ncbi:tetratricopeptide repeat protein [Streptomyces sp. NPDC014636]|uniref:tetratricopeptide repeat protein n=1 Tax=Streptomyces sp. NPDC014636 TaxID=3364876 RepID=UPI0036FBBD51
MVLWTGVAATVVVANAVSGWVHLPGGDSPATPVTTSGSASPAATPVRKTENLLQTGIRQGENKDFPGAARSFKRVLDLEPANKFAWYNLGVIAQHDNRTADARTAYDHALKSDPGFEPALYNKAILLGPTDTDQAIVILRHIVDADPKAATAYLHLGQALARKGRHDEAEDAFGLAVHADPSLRQFVPERFRASASAASTATQAGIKR